MHLSQPFLTIVRKQWSRTMRMAYISSNVKCSIINVQRALNIERYIIIPPKDPRCKIYNTSYLS